MKKVIITVTLILIIITAILCQSNVANYIMTNYIYKRDIVIKDANKYKKILNANYVQETTDFEPASKKELMNILYTILNNGWDEFTFFCDTNYDSCVDDVNELIENRDLISNLNNFVSPYNSYNSLYVKYNNIGKITITVDKIYNNDKLKYVDNKIDEIIKEIIKPKMSDKDKIKAFHDYIINNTIYDSENADKLKVYQQLDNSNNSYNAYGLLTNHVSLCGGYSDSMAIFLDKMNIPNMKISNNLHVWNLVYLDNKWLHLDLTWDDPVVNTKENLLVYNYFLITTNELQSKDNEYHSFDTQIYSEAK